MITILVLTAIALGLACLVLIQSQTFDPDQMYQRRPAPLTMAVQIICGDCAGDGRQPLRTCLDRHGRCAQCGGSSYLLASIAASNRAAARAERVREAHAGSSRGRVIPFKVSVSRASGSTKMAV